MLIILFGEVLKNIFIIFYFFFNVVNAAGH